MKTHHGSCHCGAVTFTVDTDLEKVMDCNCSHCSRKGLLLTFVPAEQFQLISGKENLTEYLFNKKTIHHEFCKTCGVQCFGHAQGPDGKEMVAVNVRCLPDVDTTTLTIDHADGKKF